MKLFKSLPLLLCFVALPLVGSYIGYQLGKSAPLPVTRLAETKSIVPNPTNNTISLSDFNLSIPSSWKLDNINPIDGAIITTQNLPYHVTLMLKIVKVKQDEVMKGDLVGTTIDQASIFEETGIGGARFTPYVVTYPNGDVYNYQWDMASNQTNPQADGIWTPDHNFNQESLLTIVKSSSKNR